MTTYNVHQAIRLLNNYYITDSIQMVTRWIRQKRIKAERSEYRKDGWNISHDDLFDFIEEMRPGLPQIIEAYEAYIKEEVEFGDYNRSQIFGLDEAEESALNSRIKGLENEINDLKNELAIAQKTNLELTLLLEESKENNYFLEDLYYQTDEMYKEALKGNNYVNRHESERIRDLENEIIQLNSQLLGTNETIHQLQEVAKIQEFNEVDKKTQGGEDEPKQNEKKIVIKSTSNRKPVDILPYTKFKAKYEKCWDDIELSGEELDAFLKDFYSNYFASDEKLLRSITIKDTNEFKCPISGEIYRNFRNMVKKGIKVFYKKTIEEQGQMKLV
ncbi:hypothetical protein IM538_03865 [Cytobacillus suaedae]|nr:hypothetical protein IM538_03865 [Cytobacillus suaedae]